MTAEPTTELPHRTPDFERRTIPTSSERHPEGSPVLRLDEIPIDSNVALQLVARVKGMRGEM
ncbi:hypothetical protein [Streptacidiphilus sp. MAP5-52]|uniref:hypothetical protein n=1 Tax=Streptacidiphilus sp. MAP5-52 TaxID=3156267 RepID=UPI003516CE86